MLSIELIAEIPNADFGKVITKSVKQSIQTLRAGVIRSAPVLTGNLRRSIQTEGSKPTLGKGIVGTKLKYGKRREFENMKNPNRKFYFKKGMDKSTPKVINYFDTNLKEELEEKIKLKTNTTL